MTDLLLLHPSIAPWLVRGATGCRVTLLYRGPAPRIVYLRAEPDNEELLIAMQPVGERNGLTSYEAQLPWDRANPTTHYAFKLIDGSQRRQIDSHDTVRFSTAVGGDAAAMAIAVTLLFGYPGVPSVYYGDEIGLEGGRDPDCRRCFDWDRAHWNAALHAHYRRLIAWRKARVEWRRGAYQVLAVTDDALVFARYVERAATLVAVNRGGAPLELEVALGDLPVERLGWRAIAGGGDGIGGATELAGGAIAIPARGWCIVFGDEA